MPHLESLVFVLYHVKLNLLIVWDGNESYKRSIIHSGVDESLLLKCLANIYGNLSLKAQTIKSILSWLKFIISIFQSTSKRIYQINKYCSF